jgi:Tol biopolymer transport system component
MLTDLGTDIWTKQLPTGPVSRLTLHAGQDRAPAWSPDGKSITYLSDRPVLPDTTRRFNLWQQSADGTGEPRLLWGKDVPTDAFWSPDGRRLVLGVTRSTGASAHGDVLGAPGGDTPAHDILATAFDETGAAVSPDARWLAYVSNEQGTNEVFVRPFPDASAGKWQVSSGGGSAPVWAPDGRALYYVAGGRMHEVAISAGPPFSAAAPRVLFTVPDRVRAGSPYRGMFAIAPNNQRFLMVRDNLWADMAGTPTLVTVQGFFEELREKLRR